MTATSPTTRHSRATPSASAALNLLAKATLIGLLVFAVLRPDLPQFAGKAMETRLFTFGLSAVLLPVVWALAAGLRRDRAYPHVTDALIVAPFLMDTAGNALDLYDRVVWFDDVMHFATWVPWVVAFGLLLHYAPALPRWAHFGLVLGFGAITHNVWELAEYVSFIRDSPELATAYTDTLGDLLLSLIGSLAGAVLSVTALWSLGRRQAAQAP
jgi:hypothetical protein